MSGNVLPIANTIQLWNNKRLVSNLYQDDTNMRESAYRTLNRQNYSVSFANVRMGSTANSLNFNKDSIVNHVLIEFELPGVNAATLSNGRGLPAGWAWMLVRRYTMQYSGSNSLEIHGRDNFIRAMAEAETKEKRDQLIALGGSAVYKSGPATVEGADSDGIIRGAVLLYLPHSSVSGAKQIGFDCSQCNSSPIIRLDLTSALEMWTDLKNLSDTVAVNNSINEEMQKVNGKFYVGETAMIDSANSRRDMVGPSGLSQSLMFFGYPGNFQTFISINSKVPTLPVDVQIENSDTQNVTIDSFLNGSCQYLLLYVEREDGFEDAVGIGGVFATQRQKRNPLKYVRLSNIKITYGGGNTVYEAPTERIANLLDTVINPNDSTFNYESIYRSGVPDAVDVVKVPTQGYFYRIQISQFSELYKMFSLLQTGANLGSDQLKLSMQIVDNPYCQTVRPIKYRVNVQQLYQASMTVARGNVKFDFVNSSPQALPAQLSIST